MVEKSRDGRSMWPEAWRGSYSVQTVVDIVRSLMNKDLVRWARRADSASRQIAPHSLTARSWTEKFHSHMRVISLLWSISWGGTAAAVPPPFRPSEPALCGSCPLVTPYYCRLGDLLCFMYVYRYSSLLLSMHVCFVLFPLFDLSFVDFPSVLRYCCLGFFDL